MSDMTTPATVPYPLQAAGHHWLVDGVEITTLPDGGHGISFTEIRRMMIAVALELLRRPGPGTPAEMAFLCDIGPAEPADFRGLPVVREASCWIEEEGVHFLADGPRTLALIREEPRAWVACSPTAAWSFRVPWAEYEDREDDLRRLKALVEAWRAIWSLDREERRR